MKLNDVINEKIESIKSKTGGEVKVEEVIPQNYQGYGALVDFKSWDTNGRSGLPTIFIDKSIGKVHLLHELIHIEKFFVERYPIVVSPPILHIKIDVFKNIVEDYVVHKIINDVYNLNPISPMFLSRDNVADGRSDKQLASDLTQYHFFSELDKQYKVRLWPFMTNCKRQRPAAYSIAQKAIECVSGIDYKDKSSYEEGVKKLIVIFEPGESNISIKFFKKQGGNWEHSTV